MQVAPLAVWFDCKGPTYFRGKPNMRMTEVIAAVAFTAAAGCSPSGARTLPLPSTPRDRPDTGVATHETQLLLRPGQFRYDLLLNGTIQVEGEPDSLQSLITTTAVLVVEVTDHNESTYEVRITADSLQVAVRESSPRQIPIGPVYLGPVLRASLTPQSVTVEDQLADSLCAYGHVLSTARELLVPQLGIDGSLAQRASTRDTATTVMCRAGARISAYTERDLSNSRRNVPNGSELMIRGQTELAGTGALRNDSVAVTGSLTSQGSVIFLNGLRLPNKVQTQTTGRIHVRIGDSTTVFQQTTNQIIELRPIVDSLKAPFQQSDQPPTPPN
jgi:hypothetical protein